MEKKKISWEILLRKVRQTLSPDEEAYFQEWLKEDERHRDYYERVRKTWSVDEVTSERNTDISKMIAGFNRHVRKELELKRKKMIRNMYRYAACLLLLLGLGGILFFYMGGRQKDNTIEIARKESGGKGKVTVLLADGKEVDVNLLSDSVLYHTRGIKVQKNAGMIKYTGNQQTQETYNTITTPRGGEYQVELSDGTKVWLNSDTRLKIPTSFVGNERRVTLSGEAYFAVTKDAEKPFIVETDLGEVKVYGTEFNVKRYKDDKLLKATLIEGSIGFSSDKVAELKIKPGYQLRLADGDEQPEINQVKIYNEIAWRKQQFCFENETLDEIMQTLERWYDVEIVFADPTLKKLEFSGTLGRYEKIETLLQLFEEGVEVQFIMKNDTIKVMRK